MGRRDRGKGSRGGSRGGPQDRVRGRVRARVQGHSGKRESGKRESGGGADRKRGVSFNLGGKRGASFDVGDIGEYADRLAGRGGGLGGGRSAGGGIDASAFAGAASGLAGAGFASKFLKGEAEGSDEDFRREVAEQLSLMDERLRRLEELMNELLGGEPEETTEGPTEPDATTGQEGSQ